MKHWMFRCQDVSQIVSESMDRKVSWGERLGIRFHLMMCRYCARHKHQLQAVKDTIRAYAQHLEEAEPTVQLSEEAKQKMKHMLRQADPNPS